MREYLCDLSVRENKMKQWTKWPIWLQNIINFSPKKPDQMKLKDKWQAVEGKQLHLSINISYSNKSSRSEENGQSLQGIKGMCRQEVLWVGNVYEKVLNRTSDKECGRDASQIVRLQIYCQLLLLLRIGWERHCPTSAGTSGQYKLLRVKT